MATTGTDDAITFVISVAAELAGMHPQTLRQYDRLGLVIPARTKGRGRRYTKRDVQRLRDVQRMSQEEGINLAGIRRILELERRVEALEEERDALRGAVAAAEAQPQPRVRGVCGRSGHADATWPAPVGSLLPACRPLRRLPHRVGPHGRIAAMSAAEPPVRSALPGPSRRSEQPGPAGRASARAVIEGTIISR